MQYDAHNALGAAVYDVEGRTKIERVVRIDVERGEVVAHKSVNGRHVLAEEVHRFASIHPIFGGSFLPVLFHCYGRLPAAAAAAPEPRWLGDMQRLQPQPGDVLVLSVDADLSAENASFLKDQMARIFGSTKIAVLSRGMKLGYVAEPQAPQHEHTLSAPGHSHCISLNHSHAVGESHAVHCHTPRGHWGWDPGT